VNQGITRNLDVHGRTAMTRARLVVLSRQGRTSVPEDVWRRLDTICEVTAVRCDGSPGLAEAVGLLADADYLGATNLCLPPLDGRLLDALPRLRGVVLYATGYDHLDVPDLRRRGVGLSVLPDYATTAVAEHALAMLLALATRLPLAHDRSRGTAHPGTSLRGVELAGRTVGVVGLGRIGTRFAGLARALGMRVTGTDPDPVAAARATAAGVDVGGLGDVLRRADAVVLAASHVGGRPAILGARELELARPGTFIVNVGRPALVDTPAALAALRTRRLRGYAVDDVVADPALDADVLREGRLLQTGHSAWWRDEVLERGARMWGDSLVRAVTGRPVGVVTWPGHTELRAAG